MQSQYRKQIKANMQVFKNSCEKARVTFIVDSDLELIIQQVLEIPKRHPAISTRKLYLMLQSFCWNTK